MKIVIFFLSLSFSLFLTAKPCDFYNSSQGLVCRCNATYCDTVDPLVLPSKLEYLLYSTSKSGKRLDQTIEKFSSRPPTDDTVLTLYSNISYQKIIGFGGAFTDSATLNIYNLTKNASENLLMSYFSPNGIEYNLGRIVISSCDFSTHIYSYDDYPNDFDLVNFSLTVEDLEYKIPAILAAQKMSTKPIKLFGTAWSAPAWMKTNGKMYGRGSLIGDAGNKYHKTWALYYSKFLDAYKKQGVNVWAITTQNEPEDGCIPDFPFQAMCFTAETLRDFIVTDLGPQLNATHPDVLILVFDDQRSVLVNWATIIFNDTLAKEYIDGIAIHWYEDFLVTPSVLNDTHNLFPEKFILGTEACTGYSTGSWIHAEYYARDIINDLNNWAVGWTDWNMALNMTGGPCWPNDPVESPILVDGINDTFYKGPMFYILGHFSKFVIPDSIRIGMNSTSLPTALNVVAFKTPANYMVVQVYNQGDFTYRFVIDLNDGSNRYINANIPSQTFQTYILPI